MKKRIVILMLGMVLLFGTFAHAEASWLSNLVNRTLRTVIKVQIFQLSGYNSTAAALLLRRR